MAVTSDDSSLIQFLLGGRKAVLVDPVVLCGGCYPGYNCSNRGTRDVRVYALFGSAWRMVLSNDSITGDIFVSNVPGKYRPEGQDAPMLLQEVRVSSMSFWTLAGSDCRTDDEGWAATDENVYAPVRGANANWRSSSSRRRAGS